tara:strand:- start:796 stop:1380 length:585 start_codon:yes stop_codon:yes gene_type:complete
VSKKKSKNYINNKDFSAAVCDYVESYNAHKGADKPIVPDYIALGFKQISEGLSHKPNFIGYSYRDEMVMDAIENCLRAIRNYNIEAATRTGKPNAFAYFTQICYYAFLRRIAKEKKQKEIKDEIIENGFTSDMLEISVNQDDYSKQITISYIEEVKNKLRENQVSTDEEYVKPEASLPKRRARKTNDSDLTEFL